MRDLTFDREIPREVYPDAAVGVNTFRRKFLYYAANPDANGRGYNPDGTVGARDELYSKTNNFLVL